MFEKKRSSYFEKSKKIYGEGDVQCKVGGQENTEELMDMLKLKEAVDKLAKGNGMR